MLQRRQIVKALGKQVDIEYLIYMIYAIKSFHSIDWMFISVIVTINRTDTLPQGFQSSHFISTAKLRSSI
jgi:hypothetical protein